MKPKYQTRANRAEEQVLAMLKSEKNIQKPWSLVAHTLENRTLQTTAPEAAIIFNHDASLRPGYEQKDDKVYVPNLFIKLSGKDEAFSPFQNRQELQKRENCFVYDSFKSFAQSDISKQNYEGYLEDGLLRKDEFLSSDAFNYSFLRREYQELYVDKVNEILSSKKDFFIGQGLKLTDNQILSNLCQINECYFHAFHQFDFQFQPPAIIITNKGKEKPNVNQALMLILLNLLGFDIVIHSPDGHADIENILNPDVYCLFYGDGLKYKNPGSRMVSRLRNIAAGVIIAAGLAALGFFKPLLFSHNGSPPVQGPMPNTSITYQEPDPTPAPNISGFLEFNDKALEQGIRNILERQTGDIYINDINQLGVLRFFGPYAGGSDWRFINGYSPDVYYDINDKGHREEGDIRDLSVLAKVPSIDFLELAWQKNIDLESLKGSRIYMLSLIHDNITDISPLSSLEGLTVLDIAYNSVSDISPLANLPLNTLELPYNKIMNIGPLSDMKELGYLTLAGNPILDLSPLGKLSKLYSLNLSYVAINDFSFLNSLPELTSLNLERSGLTDVSLIGERIKLNWLTLADNAITDISALKNLKLLEYIDISMTDVRDISIFKELPNLRIIDIRGVRLDDEKILSELQNVEIRR